MTTSSMGGSPALKVDVMFDGIRYTDALGEAAEHSFPNYYPYRFRKEEPGPDGQTKANIPYLLTTPDGTLIRVRGNPDSDWSVNGSADAGYFLGRHENDDGDKPIAIGFEPLPGWMGSTTSDGFPMAHAGVSLHGDMAVINVAPGCEFFLQKDEAGKSMRCVFCSYGAPDERTRHLGQEAGVTPLPPTTYSRLQETLKAALAETQIRHIYLVGGSLPDWREEGERFIALAQAVQEVVDHQIPVACGSGALPEESLAHLKSRSLVDNICFNLEIWSEELFAKICPGKQRFVGYDRWLDSLEKAVEIWGRGRVYSAMVAGLELDPDYGLTLDEASDLAIQGADDLCSRGIIPIYSLYWPVAGKDYPEHLARLRSYFEKINLAYRDIRKKHGLAINEDFMCHRCAYMQLECDVDRAPV